VFQAAKGECGASGNALIVPEIAATRTKAQTASAGLIDSPGRSKGHCSLGALKKQSS
jgi:hypothetical protein